MLTAEQYTALRAQYDKHHEWFKSVEYKAYKAADIPAGYESISNEDVSAVEFYEWMNNPPESYFLYIKMDERTGHMDKATATTWVGDVLATGKVGHSYYSNFGDRRCSITLKGTNGVTYYGTYYYDAGDYARIKAHVGQAYRIADRYPVI